MPPSEAIQRVHGNESRHKYSDVNKWGKEETRTVVNRGVVTVGG